MDCQVSTSAHKKHIPSPSADTGSALVVHLRTISEFVSVLIDSSPPTVIRDNLCMSFVAEDALVEFDVLRNDSIGAVASNR